MSWVFPEHISPRVLAVGHLFDNSCNLIHIYTNLLLTIPLSHGYRGCRVNSYGEWHSKFIGSCIALPYGCACRSRDRWLASCCKLLYLCGDLITHFDTTSNSLLQAISRTFIPNGKILIQHLILSKPPTSTTAGNYSEYLL